EIGEVVKAKGAIFFVDAVQGVGKVPFDVNQAKVDLAAISGHKMYGPKGVGALYVRRKPRVRLVAQIDGGGHARGMRSATPNVRVMVGMGKAAGRCMSEMEFEAKRIGGMRDRLQAKLFENLPECYINGSVERRLPGNLNISFAYVEGEGLMMAMKDVAVSSGS